MEKKYPAFGTNHPCTHQGCEIFLIGIAILSLAFASSFPEDQKETEEPHVRKAAVAGGFYPGSKQELENFVDNLLKQADAPEIKGKIQGIMVPHAGYIYSGPVAASAFKTIQGKDFDTVILMCNSHRHYLDGIAVYSKGSFETPLGNVLIDEEKTAKLLAANPKIMNRPDIHEADHVIEVQLPFLQRTLKDFKIVPILFGNDDPALSKILADALQGIIDDKTLIVASSDMSHYPPYNAASAADRQTLEAIQTGKAENLDATLKKLGSNRIPDAETFLCGVSGVRTLMLVSQQSGASKIHLLKYANSGDSFAGDKDRVVGYGAVAFVQPVAAAAGPTDVVAKAEEGELNEKEQTELLKLAKDTVESYIRTQTIPSYKPILPGVELHRGAFVTLKERGQLRGCIGRFEPDIPLYSVVQQMAVAAATQDPRFRPVSPGELDKLEYEISVLSPLRKVKNAYEIVTGKHGVQVSKGFHGGVFLPQVATETGWTKEEFLSELCSQKAGLPRDCWKDPSVTLQVFTAQVFPEEKK